MLDDKVAKGLKEFLKEKSIEDFLKEHLDAVIYAVTKEKTSTIFAQQDKPTWKKALGL